MDKSETKDIVNNHYKKLDKFIKVVSKNFETEAIHQSRVEYKKLRAFLRMITEEKESKEKITIPGKLKKGYHVAGSIRDLQLQHQRILAVIKDETKKPGAYLQLLKQHIKKLKPVFSHIPLKKTIKKTIKKRNESAPEKITATHPGKFINYNCMAITAIITSRDFTDVNMHAIRKHLKDIFYTIKTLEDAHEEGAFNTHAITKDEMEYFDKFLEEMGNFQDKCTSLVLLNEQWLHLLNSRERQVLFEVKKTLTAEKYTTRNDLLNKLEHEIITHLQVFQNIDMHPAN